MIKHVKRLKNCSMNTYSVWMKTKLGKVLVGTASGNTFKTACRALFKDNKKYNRRSNTYMRKPLIAGDEHERHFDLS